MRLIDADELSKWISGQIKSPSCPKNESAFGLRIMKHIDRMLSVQPEIIHCKDCKHWRDGIGFFYCDKLYGMGVLNMYDYMKTEDEYCSMAERRTDD